MSIRRLAFLLGAIATASLWSGMPSAFAGITFDVAITKSHTGNFTAGQQGAFTITLHNNGPSATGSDTLTVTDTLPSSLTYVSDTGSTAGMPCAASGQTVTCSGAPNSGSGIASGSNLAFTLTVQVAANAPSSVQNTATFSDSFNGDTNATNNSSTDTVTVDPAASSSPSASPSQSPTSPPTTSPTTSPTTVVSTPSTSPSVAATGTSTLPATGFPAALALLLGIALVGCGSVGFWMTRASRR